jgi:hypothetical protein
VWNSVESLAYMVLITMYFLILIYFPKDPLTMSIYRDLARILRPLPVVTFAEQIFFGLIMNKQDYNELNLI